MLRNILNLKGVKVLSKAEQRNVKGGFQCYDGCDPEMECCYWYGGLQSCGRACHSSPNCNCM